MIDKLVLKISTNQDINNFISEIEDNSKINHFHLELIGNKPFVKNIAENLEMPLISHHNFITMWEKIKKLDLYNRIHLDISNLIDIDDKWIDVISESLQNFNPREINFNFSDSKFSDNQFQKILFNSLSHMDNLEKLHLIMENVKISSNKMKSIENIVKILRGMKLNHVYINLKRNELEDVKLVNLNEVLENILKKEIDI